MYQWWVQQDSEFPTMCRRYRWQTYLKWSTHLQWLGPFNSKGTFSIVLFGIADATY